MLGLFSLLKRLQKCFIRLLLLLSGLWSVGAFYYTANLTGHWQVWGTVAYTLLLLVLYIAFRRGQITAAWDMGAIISVVIAHFIMLTPQEVFSKTDWQTPWLRRAHAIFDHQQITIYDVRNFRYRSAKEFDINYIAMQIDPDKVLHLDVALSHWNGLEKVAHTMLTFSFSDGQHLAFSMETRVPQGKKQGLIPGLFKQYELLMVVATEQDIFKLRTDHRQEELYLYRTNADKKQCREILESLLQALNHQHSSPEFYNSITRNCTTSLTPILRKLDPGFTDDIRLLLNGNSDELLYDLGYLAHRPGESFTELKKRRKVNQYIHCHPDYPSAIRTAIL